MILTKISVFINTGDTHWCLIDNLSSRPLLFVAMIINKTWERQFTVVVDNLDPIRL